LEDWFAVFALDLLVERIAHEQCRQGEFKNGATRYGNAEEGAKLFNCGE
jgi:hypothetical protein